MKAEEMYSRDVGILKHRYAGYSTTVCNMSAHVQIIFLCLDFYLSARICINCYNSYHYSTECTSGVVNWEILLLQNTTATTTTTTTTTTTNNNNNNNSNLFCI
jgi:hypothetical protein